MKYYFKCPSCRSDDEFALLKEESSGLGFLLFFFCGLIPALLYADVARRRVQCTKCGYIFRQPPLPRTALSRISTWIIGIIILFLALTSFMIAFPQIVSLFPQSSSLGEVEKLVSDNPRAIILGILPMILLVTVLSMLASWASNRRAHAELKKKFETKPKLYGEEKPDKPTSGWKGTT